MILNTRLTCKHGFGWANLWKLKYSDIMSSDIICHWLEKEQMGVYTCNCGVFGWTDDSIALVCLDEQMIV